MVMAMMTMTLMMTQTSRGLLLPSHPEMMKRMESTPVVRMMVLMVEVDIRVILPQLPGQEMAMMMEVEIFVILVRDMLIV